MMEKLSLGYHKSRLRALLNDYVWRMRGLDCGRELAAYMLSWVHQSENEIDKHITAINTLDNKSFKLFREGWLPSQVVN